jgi:hypothetical protein
MNMKDPLSWFLQKCVEPPGDGVSPQKALSPGPVVGEHDPPREVALPVAERLTDGVGQQRAIPSQQIEKRFAGSEIGPWIGGAIRLKKL